MGRFVKRPADERRRAVLTAALKLFAERGYGAVTMDDIAHAAGLTKGGVYFHFPSKEAVLLAALQHQLEQFADQLRSRLMAEPDPRRRLDLYVQAHLSTLGETASLQVWAEALRRPEGRDLLRDAYRSARRELQTLLQTTPDGSTDASETWAALLIACLDGLELQWLADPEAVEALPDLSDAVARLVMGLL
jgi:AcrR family transcriptional regulator